MTFPGIMACGIYMDSKLASRYTKGEHRQQIL